MKRLLAASLVVLAGLFLSPQPGAFLGTDDSPGFYRGVPERPILDLDFRISLDDRITFTRASEATCFNSAGVLTTFASGAARLPCYTYDGTNWINRGFLIEEARTNVALQSEDLETTWTIPGANTTITANAGTAVDGNDTAEDVLHDDNAETIQQTITATDNTVYTICANVKQGSTGSHDFVKIAWLDESDGANGFEAWFDISDGTVGTAQADGTGSYTSGSASIIDLSGGWYRVCAAGQIVSGQTDARFEIINTTADAVDTAEATNSVFWWGLSAEIGAFGLSYSATTTSEAVRAADIASMHSFATDIINPLQGTFYIRVLRQHLATGDAAYVVYVESEAQASDDPHIIMFGNASTSGSFNNQYLSSGNDANATVLEFAANTDHQIILSYAQDDFVAVRDGGTLVTDSTVDVETGFDEFFIGKNDFEQWWNGYIAQITYWNRRLNNGRLQDKTVFLDWFRDFMIIVNDNEPFNMIDVAA